MASGISAAGLGSGLDIEGLIKGLMSVERRPISQLTTREQGVKSQVSALGTLKGLLSTLQTTAQALGTQEKFAAFKASLADTTVATAAATGAAAAGSYSVEVTGLAQGQKVKSDGYAASSSSIATGTLTLQIGSLNGGTFTADGTKTKNIVIDGTNNTLSGLRDAINAANAGVTASIINDGSGTPYRLILTGKETGTTNAFRLSGLTGFDFNPADLPASTLSQVQGVKDATLKVDQIDIVKTSNVVSDVIPGVTLTLTKTNTGTPTTLNVTADVTAMTDKINAFVKAYNDVVNNIKTQTAYDEKTKKAGMLNGDSAVRSIQSQLRAVVGSSVGNAEGFSRLADIGIKINVDGTMTTDSAKLNAALTNPTRDVSSLFSKIGSTSGFAAQIDTKIKDFLATDGVLTARTDGLNKTISDIGKRVASLETRMETIEARYRRQFTALDTTVAGLNSTGNYLQQQLSRLL